MSKGQRVSFVGRRRKPKAAPKPKANSMLAVVVESSGPECGFALWVPPGAGTSRVIAGRFDLREYSSGRIPLRRAIRALPFCPTRICLIIESKLAKVMELRTAVRFRIAGVAEVVGHHRFTLGAHLSGLGFDPLRHGDESDPTDLVEYAIRSSGVSLAQDQRLEARAIGLLLLARTVY